MRGFILFLCLFVLCCGQRNVPIEPPLPTGLHNGLSEKIGNFSLEILYHTSVQQDKNTNLILSPITMWTVLAVIAEGASGETQKQLNNALRLRAKNRDTTRNEFRSIAQWLLVNTNTVQLAKINTIFVDTHRLLEKDFQDAAKIHYDTSAVSLDFTDGVRSANYVNQVISNVTRGRIPKLVESDYFADAQMILTSAVYFKGQWAVPFNTTSTSKMPFYDSKGIKIGDVNMMYNRHTYPFTNINKLQARIIELPYGKENRLSMLIMLPHPGVSLENMFLNFNNVTLDSVFSDLRVARDEFGEDEVDCMIPRFKIESNLDLTDILKNQFNLHDLFDQSRASLTKMARTPMFVKRVIHKAEIEVTEEGTVASGVTAAEFSNRIGVSRFEANRPFTYLIIEKVTNAIVFGGFYLQPSLY